MSHINFDRGAQAKRERDAMRRLVVFPARVNLFAGVGLTFAITFIVAFPFVYA